MAPAATSAATPAESFAPAFRRFTVEIPTYLYEDIKTRISKKDQTKQSVVLNAFHEAGFYVAAEDLVEDGRRGKYPPTPAQAHNRINLLARFLEVGFPT